MVPQAIASRLDECTWLHAAPCHWGSFCKRLTAASQDSTSPNPKLILLSAAWWRVSGLVAVPSDKNLMRKFLTKADLQRIDQGTFQQMTTTAMWCMTQQTASTTVSNICLQLAGTAARDMTPELAGTAVAAPALIGAETASLAHRHSTCKELTWLQSHSRDLSWCLQPTRHMCQAVSASQERCEAQDCVPAMITVSTPRRLMSLSRSVPCSKRFA